ncbi:leucine efflux protein LeuE [Alcaligenes sp. SDU_A2]|uniref:leucine efflux protein LeuE n=1 Tax=Alcaligenes sp. SDU_A2 TaxID=3136634 RepID=UPI002C2247F6|nr:leucine efflux protein LeuE [Alcaligenes sp.]HRL26856.1 leucine efflux protein LeuE [Alcaligenes sp.]
MFGRCAQSEANVLEQIGIVNFWAFVVGTLFIVLLPGPNSLYVLASGAGHGVREGYKAALGVLVGDGILMTLTALGAASLLKTLPMFYTGIRWLGAAYLLYLGVRLLQSAFQQGGQVQSIDTRTRQQGRFRKALFLSLLNPKAILFFLSFFVQFVDPAAGHTALAFLVLGLVVQVISFCYLSLLIVGGDRLAGLFRRHQRLSRLGNGSVGVLFMGFAARMISD